LSIRRIALGSAIIGVLGLGFGASPALAQIPLQPTAPTPVASTPNIPSGQPIYIPFSTGSAGLLSASGGSSCSLGGPLGGCG